MQRTGNLALGKQRTVLNVDSVGAGEEISYQGIEADTVLVSLFAESVGGELDVTVATIYEEQDGTVRDTDIISFPTLNSATTCV